MKNYRAFLAVLVASGLALTLPTLFGHAVAKADETAYLIAVTVRPGYHFPNGDPLAYGYEICEKAAGGRTYPDLMSDVRDDLNTTDEFQAMYLISQAANELCPAQIWSLRNSAVNYRPPSNPAGDGL
ncbi:DUF732 domain-containing protein [Mycobacterium sp. 1274756.6]|uniref:DUF732 domain-containing protein n=1 Tax=Mycobacterium sp. 1274756.6 TaxID=1834076 RepID=UPI0007FC25ED|nr:DUF732 domain-containing protein [Mycobacterium sp. 1274756.6]OBJ70681.1 hypothetical protein A5643_09890 [Mycobacterium sp. 1274756.6]